MRKFHSYGPVDYNEHFCIERKELIKKCMEQLIGNPDKDGHYFTIWAPRQTGKTWLMRQVKQEIENKYKDRFIIAGMSMQGVIINKESLEAEKLWLNWVPQLMLDSFNIKINELNEWKEWIKLFHRTNDIFTKPVILFIDEFDSLPSNLIDRLVTIFRDMYLKRENYWLHGLALIGVRAVLGVDSDRGSPFNIQRSLHVPNFIKEEVFDLFQQYQDESRQKIDNDVVEKLYEVTRGQPGLVCWFGELLTERYNQGEEKTITINLWKLVYRKACYVEWNNTLLNLIKKAKSQYLPQVLELFARSDILFNLRIEWCSYLYLNGIIDYEQITDVAGEEIDICRFSSPFVQITLYHALTNDLAGDHTPILALDPLDDLSDVFEEKEELDLYALLQRYKDYLKRLKNKGLNPWKEQPRRSDLHLTEAVGHFHLYAWLYNAISSRCCSISPEFPTGNGRVDLHIKCGEKIAIIEVKSFIDISKAKGDRKKASQYAKKLGLKIITMAVFVPVEDENVLNKLSIEEIIDGVKIKVTAISWV